jgi:hypothetical protein
MMQSAAATPDQYIHEVDEVRRPTLIQLRNSILNNLPKGFEEIISYGMINYVVPHSLYSKGYHVNPSLPLPFIAIASQKNFVALYHMGLYADQELLTWFKDEYATACRTKLDMGKSCIRFRKMDDIPFVLIGKLALKMTVKEWIAAYERLIC